MIFARERVGGLTLLEVNLATFILLVVLVSSLSLIPTISRYMGQSRERLLANYVAVQTIEEIRNSEFDDAESYQGKGSYTFQVEMRGQLSNFVIGYDVNVVSISETMKSVQVVVNSGKGGGVRLETFLYSGRGA